MVKVANNFREYLHKNSINPSDIEMFLKTIDLFFQKQGVDFKSLRLKTLKDVLMLQSFFKEKFLRQYQAGVGVNEKNFYIFFYFGNYLVSQSFLSENPAEKAWKIPAKSSKTVDLFLREKTYLLKSGVTPEKTRSYANGSRVNFEINNLIRMNLILLSLIFIAIIGFNLSFRHTSFSKKTTSLSVIKNLNFKSLKVAKPIFAKEKNKNLGLFINLSTEKKIVSSSATRVIKTNLDNADDF